LIDNVVPNLLLSDTFLLPHIVIQLPALHVLKDEDNAVLLFEYFIDVDNIGVVQPYKHFYLIFGSQEISLV
jgi:hypothetical protein